MRVRDCDKVNQMDNLSQIIGYTDKLSMLRALLSYPIINWVSQFFSRTRSAETKLYFVEYCRDIIKQNRDKISEDEYAEYDQALIHYELSAYDRLNLWDEYIILFEKTLEEKSYTMKYSASRDDPVFNSYVLRQDRNCKYVHFLYTSDRRYNIIRRKQKRMEDGKTVEHLKRHQQDRLSEEELSARYAEMARLFEYIKRQHSG